MESSANLTTRARQLADLIEARQAPARADEGGDVGELLASLVRDFGVASHATIDVGGGRQLEIRASPGEPALASLSVAGAGRDDADALRALDAAIGQLNEIRF